SAGLRQDARAGQGRGHARQPRSPSRVSGQSSLEHDSRRSAHAGNARKAGRAVRAQRVHPGRHLGRRFVRPVGRGAGQGARSTHHPRDREQDGAEARPRQLDERAHPALPDAQGARPVRREMGEFKDPLEKMRTHPGFSAALDQSGGSPPNALRAYGIKGDAWSNEEQMFAIVHQMRTRIMTSPVFTGTRILGAILFENTIDRDVEGKPTADYLWNAKRVVPFLKVDKGLAAESRGVQLMKPMPELAALLDKATEKHISGTKMRSFIKQANDAGIKDVVTHHFKPARKITAAGLVPIVEPEVDIHCPEK